MSWTPDQMAQQVAMALRDGEFVDVGGGVADDVLRHVSAGTERRVHLGEARSGMTQYPTDDYMDAGFIVTGQDASQAQRTIMFHSSESFAAMSITTADVAIREAADVTQVPTVVSTALQSVRAQRVVFLIKGHRVGSEMWQGPGPGVHVRIVTQKAGYDVAPDGLQKTSA
ncbi:hypothetical protein [Cupriavidus pauculus]|uniref:Uncharacterized protein n=1 Tax=Cupriavidus pauculus TaxID=82633 RepID=A0A2N5C5M5_9BURK|nr:hypothetical protein [Cupriavidus pauculus]PLP97522.1 hypothetical protein CYJ10_27235 [Cupriavidus pauculus]